MSLHIHLLCVDTPDSKPCIVVSCQNQRFLFDVGEGTQRLCVEHKVRLGRVSAVLITKNDSTRFLGLPGFCLTAVDSGNTGFCVVGPSAVKRFMHATRYFMRLPANYIDFRTSNEFDFGDLTLEAIGFAPATTATTTTATSTTTTTATSPVSNAKEDIATTVSTRSEVTSSSHICYCGRTPRAKGKFDINRAIALNIPRGPMFGQLKNGKPVTLNDGTVILPEQVLDEPELGKAFLIIAAVELPVEESILQCMLVDESLNRFSRGDNAHVELEFVVHLSPIKTIQSTQYQQWLSSFPAAVKHVLAGRDATAAESAYVAATRYANKLHRVVPAVFTPLRLQLNASVEANTVAATTVVARTTTTTTTAATTTAATAAVGKGSNCAVVEVVPQIIEGRPQMKLHLLPIKRRGEVDVSATVSGTDHCCCCSDDKIHQEVDEFYCDAVSRGLQEHINRLESIRSHVRKAVVSKPIDDGTNSISSTSSGSGNSSSCSSSNGSNSNNGINNYSSDNVLTDGVTACLRSRHCSIKFLGTGCAVPSKYRNVSGICLQLGLRGASILLDAGEGSWSQLQRLTQQQLQQQRGQQQYQQQQHQRYQQQQQHHVEQNNNPALLCEDVSSAVTSETVRAIWISHPHADHHMGLVTVIAESYQQQQQHQLIRRQQAPTTTTTASTGVVTTDNLTVQPIVLIAPPAVLAFLEEYCQQVDSELRSAYFPISSRQFDPDDSCCDSDVYWKLLRQCDNNNNNINNNNNSSKSSNNNSNNSNSSAGGVINITYGDEEDRSSDVCAAKRQKIEIIATSSEEKLVTAAVAASVVADFSASASTATTSVTDTSVTTTASRSNNSSSSNNNSWRSYKHVFREQVSFALRELLLQRRCTAVAMLRAIGVTELSNVAVIHCSQSYGLCIRLKSNESAADCIINDSSVVATTTNAIDPTINATSTTTTALATTDVAASKATTTTATNTTTTVTTATKTATTATTATTTTATTAAGSSSFDFSLVYSGDTRPSDRLISAGRNATILIHEATFEDNKSAEAATKRHCTIGEAVEVAVKMAAFRLIATHFSQRYPGVPQFTAQTINCYNSSSSDSSSSDSSSGNRNGSSSSGSCSGEGDSNSLTTAAAAAYVTTLDRGTDINDTTAARSSDISNNNSSNNNSNSSSSNSSNRSRKASEFDFTTANSTPILAFDYMNCTLEDLLWMPAMVDVLNVAFPPDAATDASEEQDGQLTTGQSAVYSNMDAELN